MSQFRHSGYVHDYQGVRRCVRLRETKHYWITLGGTKFSKDDGELAVEQRVTLDLSSIRLVDGAAKGER